MLGDVHNKIERNAYPPEDGCNDPPSRPNNSNKKIVSIGEGLAAIANAQMQKFSQSTSSSTVNNKEGNQLNTRLLLFIRNSSTGNDEVVKQVLFVPRQISYESTVYDAMVKVQQKEDFFFMDNGNGDIQFSYKVGGVVIPLSYKKDSKDTIISDLFSVLEDKTKPFELSYMYSGVGNTVLLLE